MRLRQLQRENQKFEAAIEALRREENQLQQLSEELAAWPSSRDAGAKFLKSLTNCRRSCPIAPSFQSALRAGVLEVQGNAENASALIPLLERSPVFENVAFNAPSNRGRDNRETFSLKAEVEKPKDAAKEPPSRTPRGSASSA